MKVYVTATSGESNYPDVCGLRDFNSIDDAAHFVHCGADMAEKSYTSELILIMNTKPFSRYYKNADMAIEIYDDYRE